MNDDDVQRAVYAKLTGDVGFSALSGLYADVQQPNLPEDAAAFPYTTFGPATSSPFDTKTDFGGETLLQLDIWSRSNNYIETKDIAKAIHTALHHEALTIANANHVLTEIQSIDYVADPDGHTKHGIVSVRIVYDALI